MRFDAKFEELKGRTICMVRAITEEPNYQGVPSLIEGRYTSAIFERPGIAKGDTILEFEVYPSFPIPNSDGRSTPIFRMEHDQDCCEHVEVEDVVGDVRDILGTKILKAEESTNTKEPKPWGEGEHPFDDSFTWTFYRLTTIRGSLVIRWLGRSNGYYSERVNCCWKG